MTWMASNPFYSETKVTTIHHHKLFWQKVALVEIWNTLVKYWPTLSANAIYYLKNEELQNITFLVLVLAHGAVKFKSFSFSPCHDAIALWGIVASDDVEFSVGSHSHSTLPARAHWCNGRVWPTTKRPSRLFWVWEHLKLFHEYS